MSERAPSAVGRTAARLSLPLMLSAFILAVSSIRLGFLPAPVTIDRGGRVDVYTWESVIAALLFAIGGLCVALTTDIDASAPPERMLFRRVAKWTGWIAGVGGSIAAVDAGGDAVSALQNLGFKPAVAASAVAHALAELGADAGLNDLVRIALRRAAG